jgi:DNA-binding MarR family transcriptional regulator
MDQEQPAAIDNIGSLIQILGHGLDNKLREYRKGTRYESVRASDVRVFFTVWRKPRTISETARFLQVSRQAVHMSVKRLSALKVLDFDPESKGRDKRLIVTDRGMSAREAAMRQVKLLEDACEEVIGREDLETLRRLLTKLCQSLATEGYQKLMQQHVFQGDQRDATVTQPE